MFPTENVEPTISRRKVFFKIKKVQSISLDILCTFFIDTLQRLFLSLLVARDYIIQHRFALIIIISFAFLIGGGEGSRTPVHKHRHKTFFECSYLFKILLV